MFSWLGDPDVSVMSEDGHRVLTHRAVLGLYSSSLRHLLSINPTETCMIIFHDMNSLKLEEIIGIARNNFQKLFIEGYPKKEDEENQTKLNSEPGSVEDKMIVKEKVETSPLTPSYDPIESNSDSSSRLNNEYIGDDNETLTNEENNDGKNQFTPLRNHLKLISIEDVNISIDRTSEAYKEYLSLDRYGQHNPETKRIACNLCDKSYGGRIDERNRSIRYHVDSSHMEKYLSCRFCKKEFFSVVNFMKHYREHLSKYKFKCKKCGTITSCKNSLSNHMAAVHLHQKNFKCDLCDKSYKDKYALKGHIQSKHEDRKFPCEYCNHLSVSQASLFLHRKLKHENVKSFKCKDCDYVCRRSDYLKRHIRSIHENLRFPCNYCEYQATRKQYLESHIKTIHNKDSIDTSI